MIPPTRVLSVLLALLLLLVTASAAMAATYRDCTGLALEPGGNYVRCDMRAMPFPADLSGANMNRANLAGLYLDLDYEVVMSGATLVRADLTGTNLSTVYLTDADLRGASMVGARMEETQFQSANFSRADLTDASWFDAWGAHALFVGATLDGAEIEGTFLMAADFTRASLRGTTFSASSFDNLVGATFTRSDLTGATFNGMNLTGATFLGATGLDTVTWINVTCPDGTNSDANGGTCMGHV